MAFNFKNAKPATGAGAFLRPGYHTLKAISATSGEFDGGNEYVEVVLEDKDEVQLKEKFLTTSKDGDAKKQSNLLGRLQHLYEGITGMLLDKNFKSTEEIATFFDKLFQNKKNVPRLFLVGGEDDNGKIWARLPWGGFIVPKENEDEVTEGDFDEGSKEWKNNVKKRGKTEASGKEGGILNGGDDDDDDLPFEDDTKAKTDPKAKGKGKVTEPVKTTSKGKVKEKEKEEEESTEDEW